MKNTGWSFNRFRLLTAAIAFIVVPRLFAQYSDSTLNGPWFERSTVFDSVAVGNLGYLSFDGNGHVADLSKFNMGCSGFLGNYSVQSNDSFSMNLYDNSCGSLAFAGQLISNSSATDMAGTRLLWKVPNPGALSDSLTGVLNSAVCGQKNIALCLDSEGVITSCNGIDGPVSGSVYADSGLFMGHIKTGDTTTCPGASSGWSEFSIAGKYANDSLKGIMYFSDSGVAGGTVLLVRKRLATSVVKKGVFVESQRVACRAVRNGVFFITMKNPVDGNLLLRIMDLRGSTVARKVVQCVSGSRDVTIDLGCVPRGVYIVLLQASGFTVRNRVAIE